MKKIIVAEISKNWIAGESGSPLLATQFEDVIEINNKRGYDLHSFQVSHVISKSDIMTEIIIAVFILRAVNPS